MKNLNFVNYQEEVSIVEFKPNYHLKEYDLIFFDADYVELSLEEKLLIIVLDRDGYFFSDIKPSPEFLILLKRHGIYVQAFSFSTIVSKKYGCFLKSFIKNNPERSLKSYYNK
ncbi:hypothetical protein [uncultured Flavobacterium sp.]|uniref:hypothetical protein n=1 Tax=uncultured Flavobacterium sp. TaxID=165435 RepID=UPI002593CF2E|nr:hypothetical protein [uncultured Flavobacterium sp.]